MIAKPGLEKRLDFLANVIRKEIFHLKATDQSLFEQPITTVALESLEGDLRFSEQIDAFVTRFNRLQDTLGDKMLPSLLAFNAENIGTMIDNLDKAERFGWINSTDQWLEIRKLRNQMVHEYIEDLDILSDALNQAHSSVNILIQTAENMLNQYLKSNK